MYLAWALTYAQFTRRLNPPRNVFVVPVVVTVLTVAAATYHEEAVMAQDPVKRRWGTITRRRGAGGTPRWHAGAGYLVDALAPPPIFLTTRRITCMSRKNK